MYRKGFTAVLAWHCCATARSITRMVACDRGVLAYVDNWREIGGSVQANCLNGLRVRSQQPSHTHNLGIGVVAVEGERVADCPLRRQLSAVAKGQKFSTWIVAGARFRTSTVMRGGVRGVRRTARECCRWTEVPVDTGWDGG